MHYTGTILSQEEPEAGGIPWTSVAVEARKSRSIILVPVYYGNCFILN